MKFSLTGGTQGDERSVTIYATGSDTDFIHLIDSLSCASGLAQVLAAQLAQHTGLVNVPATEDADMARMLRYYADVLERRSAQA